MTLNSKHHGLIVLTSVVIFLLSFLSIKAADIETFFHWANSVHQPSQVKRFNLSGSKVTEIVAVSNEDLWKYSETGEVSKITGIDPRDYAYTPVKNSPIPSLSILTVFSEKDLIIRRTTADGWFYQAFYPVEKNSLQEFDVAQLSDVDRELGAVVYTNKGKQNLYFYSGPNPYLGKIAIPQSEGVSTQPAESSLGVFIDQLKSGTGVVQTPKFYFSNAAIDWITSGFATPDVVPYAPGKVLVTAVHKNNIRGYLGSYKIVPEREDYLHVTWYRANTEYPAWFTVNLDRSAEAGKAGNVVSLSKKPGTVQIVYTVEKTGQPTWVGLSDLLIKEDGNGNPAVGGPEYRLFETGNKILRLTYHQLGSSHVVSTLERDTENRLLVVTRVFNQVFDQIENHNLAVDASTTDMSAEVSNTGNSAYLYQLFFTTPESIVSFDRNITDVGLGQRRNTPNSVPVVVRVIEK